MSRKIIDICPILTVRPTTGAVADMAQAEAQAATLAASVEQSLGEGFSIEVAYEEEAQCEHCRYDWTEHGSIYNGGCCAMDEANSPDRLTTLAALIEEVEAGDFSRWDADRGADRHTTDWPWAMAAAADSWLKAGRPASGVAHLLALTKRVRSTDWCTVWSDPGPSGCSLARLPDEVAVDARPGDLADELLRLIDDMGLMPVRAEVQADA